MLKPFSEEGAFRGLFEYEFLESNLVLQSELASVGSFNDVTRTVGHEYGSVLVIEGKLAVMLTSATDLPESGQGQSPMSFYRFFARIAVARFSRGSALWGWWVLWYSVTRLLRLRATVG